MVVNGWMTTKIRVIFKLHDKLFIEGIIPKMKIRNTLDF
jgi:hypothetical protein